MPGEQKYGRTRKRSDKIDTQKLEPSKQKLQKKQISIENPLVTWFKKDWKIIVGLFVIFFISLFLRSYFYFPIATENGFLLSGNDPFYHKRVIDYAQLYFTHIKYDPLIDYPLIGVNPRPPVYDWSNAVLGLFLSPAFNGDISNTTWYIFIFSPALWGALTIFPVYFLTKDIFGRKPALISAFFMGIMSSHIERSPLGFADHDAMVVFFVVTSILFLAKALGHIKEKYWVSSWRSPTEITIGIRDFFRENPAPVAFSLLCGFSMGTVALIWKGFPYVFVILNGSFIVLVFINHLRKIDSMGIFFCIYIAFASALVISFPYYAFFTTGTWAEPLYMLMSIVIVGMFFIPTRDLPWVVVFPSFIIIVGIAVTVLSYYQPDIVEGLFTGGGYFIKSKLYSTIAEAQAPDTSRLAISYGPVTFYLALIGLVIAAITLPKQWKFDYFVIIIWCALAIYMAMSAVRFMFNATPVFAILGGWVTWYIFERLDPTFRSFKKMEIRFTYIYIAVLTAVIMVFSYWWLYLEQDNYDFFQTIYGLGLFGIFVAIFTAWIMLKYNFWIGILIYATYVVIWFWYSFDVIVDLTFGKKGIVWDKFPWEQFGFGLAILVLTFGIIIVFVVLRRNVSGSKLEMTHIAIAFFMVFLVFTPNLMFAIDASIPYESKSELDPAGKTFGAFGHSFPSEYWQAGMDWLADQDYELVIEERPAFISWWDYGFWCLYLGEHPTVADNFQAGYQLAGSFIAANSEEQAVSLFAVRIMEGDFHQGNEFSPEVKDVIIKHFDNNNQDVHPNFDKINEWYNIESSSKDEQDKLIKEVKSNPDKYGKLVDIKLRNAKYAIIRVKVESLGEAGIIDFLSELEQITDKSIRYFAVDTRLFPFGAQNTGIFYAPIKLADRDIADFIKYYAIVDVRDNIEDDWRSYSDQPIPTEEIADEVDLNDLVDTHGASNVRIKQYVIKYTDDFYNSMFYKCYIGYSYKDIYGYDVPNPTQEPNTDVFGAEVPGIYGEFKDSQRTPPMQGWNMTHFRLVYRTAYWTPYNTTTLEKLADNERDWQAMSEIEAISRIRKLEGDGKDNDGNGLVDDQGEGGVWSPSYRGGGVFFLKYYDGALIKGKIVTDNDAKTPIQNARVTVLDEYGIPHDMVFTDADGNYNVTAPFGNAILLVTKDGYTSGGDDELNQRLRLTERTTLNSTVHEISESQAMRLTSNYIINSDIKVPVAEVKGKVFWDLNNNEEFDINEDEIITNVELHLNSTIKKYNLSYSTDEIDEEGNYEIADIVPGEYEMTAVLNGHKISLPTTIELSRDEETGDLNDYEQNIAIKPAVIVGNATFVNDTEFMPGDITINLRDLTNNSLINFTLELGTKYYSFDRLLPGEYLLSVNQTKIEYYEMNTTLEQGDNISIEIDLVPLISMSGTLKFTPESLTLGGIPAKNAHVEFYNIDNSTFSKVMVTNANGVFNGEITKGNFTVYVHYIRNSEDYVHVSSISVTENEPIDLVLFLEPGFWLNGRLTKQVNTSVENTKIEFILIEEDDTETSLFIPTNSNGEYRVNLPYRKYKVQIHYTSDPGNITYVYFNNTSYLEKDVNDIIASKIKVRTVETTRTEHLMGTKEITYNIHLDEASNLWGWVYWDRNFDGKFNLDNQSLEDDNDLIPSSRGNTRVTLNSRSRQGDSAGNAGAGGDYGGYIIYDDQYPFYESELTGIEGELVVGVKLKFVHETGTLYATTDKNGYFEIFLPPGKNQVLIDDPRFLPIESTNPSNITTLMIPRNFTYQPEGLARNYSVQPVNTSIMGYTWYDKNGDGVFTQNETVPDVPITLHVLSQVNSDSNIIEFKSDSESGAFKIDLLPGEYLMEIEYNQTKVVKYLHSNFIAVPFNYTDDPFHIKVAMTKQVISNISIYAEGKLLNKSNLENTTIKFYTQQGQLIEPFPLEQNGSYFEGFIIPNNLTIYIEYSPQEQNGEEGERTYFFIGTYNFNDTNNRLKIQLQQANNFTLTAFVDEDGSGNFTNNEERPEVINVTIIEPTGAKLELNIEDGTLNHLLMPGTKYLIEINDTRMQEAPTHGVKMVRYISEYRFSIPKNNFDLDLDIPLIKYYNLSGRVFFDENENSIADKPELNSNVTVHFTGPIDFTLVSNETGGYHKFVFAGEYFVSIEHEGFLSKPVIYSYNVSLDNTTFDIQEIPKMVRVFGITYNDVTQDLVYNPDIFVVNTTLHDRPIGNTRIEFSRNVLVEPDPSSGEIPYTEPLQDSSVIVKSHPRTGEYEVDLIPGEYNVYAYSAGGTVYAHLDLILIEHQPEYDYNVSLNLGRLVEGNVFYRDTDLIEVHDLYSEETGNALKFESLDSAGSRVSMYGNIAPGIFDPLYLSYGNYTISSEYISEEYEMQMEYTLQETVEVTPDLDWLKLELNKENDYSFKFEVKGDKEIEVQSGNLYYDAFTLLIENDGNIFNLIDLSVQDAPKGWVIQFTNKSVPLDIIGKYSKVEVGVDITVPANTVAKNDITILAASVNAQEETNTLTLTVKTPAFYGFELGYEDDLDRGIKINDTIKMNLSVKNLGNAADKLNIKFYNVPPTWNVSIGEAWRENADVDYKQNIDTFVHSIAQTDIYKNITIEITSPTPQNLTTQNEEVAILVRAWSENKRELEYTKQIDVGIKKPDIIMNDIKILNADLKPGTNFTIRANVETINCYADNVTISLYIDNVLVENKTADRLMEDSIRTFDFRWDPGESNITATNGRSMRFKIEINSDRTTDELDFDNNAKSIEKFIGGNPKEEEFNWRPIWFMLTLLIAFFVVYGIYRWRKKI